MKPRAPRPGGRKGPLGLVRLATPPAESAEFAEARRALAEASAAQQDARYVLRLYVTGTTPASTRAIQRVREVCEERLEGRYELEVVDLYQLPALAKGDQIVATPTLVKVLPTPLKKFIGDLSNVEKVLFGLDLRAKERP